MKQPPVPARALKGALMTVLIAVGILCGLQVQTPVVFSAEPAQLTILHTNNVTGHLFGCPT
jgi:hypothetical protein